MVESDDGVRASNNPFRAREAFGGNVVRQTTLSAHGRPSVVESVRQTALSAHGRPSAGMSVRQTALSTHESPSAAMSCVRLPFLRTGGLRRGSPLTCPFGGADDFFSAEMCAG